MRHLAHLVLIATLLLPGIPAELEAQVPEVNTSGITLLQNFPNPVREDTRIPFDIGADQLENGPMTISIRIYDQLGRYVATPIAINHTDGAVPVTNLTYAAPGRHLAYWDGRSHGAGQVASGLYLIELIHRGRPLHRNLLVIR